MKCDNICTDVYNIFIIPFIGSSICNILFTLVIQSLSIVEQAIKILVERSRDLQKEIVAQGRVSLFME